MYFLRKFEQLNREDVLFVAPEGLHRFYLQGSSGRVGSSWMTKEDRLNDIDDYNRMLDQIAEMVIDSAKRPFETVTILGFSQGVATACRWANYSCFPFDTLVNWAGAYPPDLDFEAAHQNIKPKQLIMLCGDNDEFISEERLQEHLDFLEQQNLQPQLIRFAGAHDIYPEPLQELMERLF